MQNGGRYWDRTSGPCRVKAIWPYFGVFSCSSMSLKYIDMIYARSLWYRPIRATLFRIISVRKDRGENRYQAGKRSAGAAPRALLAETLQGTVSRNPQTSEWPRRMDRPLSGR